MTTHPLHLPRDPLYPDSDGQPMADNTLQFTWIVRIKENLESLFAHRPDVFVAGDLLWYPVQGRPDLRRAPDAMVVFGRPKGYRGSYKQWEEDGIAPQVVFEVLSPSNSADEMRKKLTFYDQHGVAEYYEYNPAPVRLRAWQRNGDHLTPIPAAHLDGWVSPRLGIRFDLSSGELALFKPDGSPFLDLTEAEELLSEAEQQRRQAEELLSEATQQLDKTEAQLHEAEQQLQQERAERARLAALLRSFGIDPNPPVAP